MEATSALPILFPGSGVQAFVGFRLVLVENRVLPQYFRLLVVDLHRPGRGRMHPGGFLGLRLWLVYSLALVDLHLHSPWLV